MTIKATPLILSFNGGEVSPLIDVRPDMPQYARGCKTLENVIPLIEGGVKRMPGSIYVAEVKHSSKITRLLPFHYSTTQAYVIELGEYYFRFYKDNAQIQVAYAAWATPNSYVLGALVTNGGLYYRCLVAHAASALFATDLALGYWETTDGATDLAYEIPNTYAEADIVNIKVFQDATTMYLCHPSYVTRKLTRSADTTWTLSYHLSKIGAEMTITAISQAATAVVTAIPVPSTLAQGDIVYIASVAGMTQVNGIFFTVGAVVASKRRG